LKPLLCTFLLLMGCESTRPCRELTLLVAVQLDDATRAADRIDVDVSLDGVFSKTFQATGYTPGSAAGTIEVEFPNGYPTGALAGIAVHASLGGLLLGSGSGTMTLPEECGVLGIAVTAGP
jgi:hypothetical protein